MGGSAANRRRWPNQLNLNILNENNPNNDPMDDDFDRGQFASLDFDALKADLAALMTDGKDWWPADYGRPRPALRPHDLAAAGAYATRWSRRWRHRPTRFAPLNSWPDNGNLDKARRLLLEPIKKKYGRKISWADLMILTGNVAMETMGFKTFGFAGGREDVWEAEDDVNWGAEAGWLEDERYSGDRELDGAPGRRRWASSMSTRRARTPSRVRLKAVTTCARPSVRMAMNDEETVALVAGGHAFGKMHGAGPEGDVAAEPEGAPMEQQLLGWKNSFESGVGVHTPPPRASKVRGTPPQPPGTTTTSRP